MQVELLDRQWWNTRIELANAIFEYIEGFHNRRRRHSALGWQTRQNSKRPTHAGSHHLTADAGNRGRTMASGKAGQAQSCSSRGAVGRRGLC
jgi:hypothetical protein